MTEDLNCEVQYHVARTKDELRQAFSLVYKEYFHKGYIPKHYKSTLRLSIYNGLPSTTTFIAKQGKKIIATVTLIPDSGLGIPMDKIYQKEVDRHRYGGRKVAEVSQLAIDSSLFPKSWFSMFNFNKLIFIFRLFKLVLDYALYVDKIDTICIAINPKHQYLYKFIGFEEMAGLKYYGNVNKAPAVARYLDLHTAEHKVKERPALYKIFFSSKTDEAQFEGKFKFSKADLAYFFLQKSDIFRKIPQRDLGYILNSYGKDTSDYILEKIHSAEALAGTPS